MDNSINSVSSLLTDSLLNQTSPSSSGTNSADFQQMLANMLLSDNVGSVSDSTDDTSSDSSSSANLLEPLMMMAVENLLSQQVNSQTSASPTATTPYANILTALTSLSGASSDSSSVVTNSPHGAPVNGPLTQNYHPGHNGLDFGVVVGTPAKATMDGKVISAGWNNEGYGNLVIVENGSYKTYYAHLSQIPVQVGQTVKAGEVVGLTGNTGHSTGPHIHYEVRYNGKPIDPTSFTLGSVSA
jgi:murein DD-endopeptidase MepM/ murein hydrolase activator NlpD